MSKTENTYKMTIRLPALTEYRLERNYRLDGSRSKNEFIERAVTRYLDFLEAEQSETLPVAIQSAINGRLGMFEDRLSKLLFKQVVETDMALSVLLKHFEIGTDYMKKLRAESVKAVTATNGYLTFEQKAQEQDDEEWQD